MIQSNSTLETMRFIIVEYSESKLTQDVATPTVPAKLAHDCLNSVPLGKESALEFVEAIEPYLEFQSGKIVILSLSCHVNVSRLVRVDEDRSQKCIQIQTFKLLKNQGLSLMKNSSGSPCACLMDSTDYL
jgi:hypothetical protein